MAKTKTSKSNRQQTILTASRSRRRPAKERALIAKKRVSSLKKSAPRKDPVKAHLAQLANKNFTFGDVDPLAGVSYAQIVEYFLRHGPSAQLTEGMKGGSICSGMSICTRSSEDKLMLTDEEPSAITQLLRKFEREKE